MPFANLLQGLDPLGKQRTTKIIGNAEAVLIGAKDFRHLEALPLTLEEYNRGFVIS